MDWCGAGSSSRDYDYADEGGHLINWMANNCCLSQVVQAAHHGLLTGYIIERKIKQKISDQFMLKIITVLSRQENAIPLAPQSISNIANADVNIEIVIAK